MSASEDDRSDDLETGEDGDFADWEEEDDEARPARCLFSDATHASSAAALRHAAEAYGFDLRALRATHAPDFYSVIQCLNYARSRVAGGVSGAAAAEAALAGIARGEHRDERFLAPALEDDPLLFEWEAYAGDGDDAHARIEDDEEAERAASRTAALTLAATAAGPAPDDAANDDPDASARAPRAPPADAAPRLAAALAAAEAENAALRLRVLELTNALGGAPADEDAPANVGAAVFSLERREGESETETKTKDDDEEPLDGRLPTKSERNASDASDASDASASRARVVRGTPSSLQTTLQRVDDNYFGSYAYFDIHRTMLDDVARTRAYRDALERNPSLVRGAKVVDVGCGTGILSMFAARGGASKVVGIDGAAPIARVARANVRRAGLQKTVTVARGKAEALVAGGSREVDSDEETEASGGDPLVPFPASDLGTYDVLVSEWMGYALLYESMLDTVIVARDALLKPGGAVLPDVATIRVAGFSRLATSAPFWDDVYGFEMPEVQDRLREDACKAAMVTPMKGAHACTDAATVKRLDLCSIAVDDLEFTSAWVDLAARSDGVRGDEDDASVKAGAGEGATGLTQRSVVIEDDAVDSPVMVHGVALWFDTEFGARFCAECAPTLSTSPHERQTHWAQTMLHLPEPIALIPPGSEEAASGAETSGKVGTRGNPAAKIKCRVGMAKCAESERARALDISLECVPVSAEGVEGDAFAKIYPM